MSQVQEKMARLLEAVRSRKTFGASNYQLCYSKRLRQYYIGSRRFASHGRLSS